MRRTSSMAALLLMVTLAGTACEAPLKPESKRAGSTAAATPSAPPSATAPTPTVLAKPPPSIRVPKLSAVPTVSTQPRSNLPVLGADVSWPQCPKGMGIPLKRSQGSPMPIPAARFVILGLTNGPGFHPNPCLASQVDWVRSRKLMAAAYSVISTPQPGELEAYGQQGPFDGGTTPGALSNVGYQQAKFNLATMRSAGLQSPIVWLDVEPVPDFDWPTDTTANAAVVRGAARGYTDAGLAVGAYSTEALWTHVVGGLRLGIPEWRAAGQTSQQEALIRCGPERLFQGGTPVISQWVEDGRDQNITCPGTSAEMGRWFHQY